MIDFPTTALWDPGNPAEVIGSSNVGVVALEPVTSAGSQHQGQAHTTVCSTVNAFPSIRSATGSPPGTISAQRRRRMALHNYIEASMPNRAHAYYGDNLTRLRQVAQRYDPDRLFTFPQAITSA